MRALIVLLALVATACAHAPSQREILVGEVQRWQNAALQASTVAERETALEMYRQAKQDLRLYEAEHEANKRALIDILNRPQPGCSVVRNTSGHDQLVCP